MPKSLQKNGLLSEQELALLPKGDVWHSWGRCRQSYQLATECEFCQRYSPHARSLSMKVSFFGCVFCTYHAVTLSCCCSFGSRISNRKDLVRQSPHDKETQHSWLTAFSRPGFCPSSHSVPSGVGPGCGSYL